MKKDGFVLDNDMQTPLPPPSKRANGKIVLACVSDTLKTKKKNVRETKIEEKKLEFFSKNLVGLIVGMPLSADLFRPSIQKHAESRGVNFSLSFFFLFFQQN